jgi:two-component system chemotaxis sensor kinase CheA
VKTNERDEFELGAARRTIDVLKRRVVVMQNGSQSTIQRQLESARRREDEARQRREIIELRAAALLRYSETLEREVARRTLAMSRILDNVKFGFFVVGRDLHVGADHTRSCAQLFSTATVAGASLLDLLRLDERERAGYSVCIDQIFEDILPEEVALDLARTEFRVADVMIRAEPSVLRDASGAVESLLYTISDVTELLAVQRENAENRMLLGILRNRGSFRLFIEDARSLLETAEEALAAGDEKTLRRALHTIKGNGSCYEMQAIVELVHAVEDGEITADGVASVRAAFTAFLREHAPVLGVEFQGSVEKLEVSVDQVNSLKRIAADLASPELHVWAERLNERPAEVFLGPIRAFTRQLAARLEKEAELSITGADTLVDEKRMRPVLITLTHLIRNAVDHGIEHVDDRGTKKSVGRLEVALSAKPSSYEIRVSDDGRGIDLARVAERAVERGIISAASVLTMSEQALHELIFRDGVSVADATTDISGRGVGMSAVLAAVRNAGGTITVSSIRHEGTTFSIVIPRTNAAGAQIPPALEAAA